MQDHHQAMRASKEQSAFLIRPRTLEPFASAMLALIAGVTTINPKKSQHCVKEVYATNIPHACNA
eukprot:m.56 g.56  ORF g.56 m.56 type:complete len:65 (+) comp31_c1_seq1:445-639(+)